MTNLFIMLIFEQYWQIRPYGFSRLKEKRGGGLFHPFIQTSLTYGAKHQCFISFAQLFTTFGKAAAIQFDLKP